MTSTRPDVIPLPADPRDLDYETHIKPIFVGREEETRRVLRDIVQAGIRQAAIEAAQSQTEKSA